MNDQIRALYESKLTTAQEAVKCVKSGQTVYIGTCSSLALALCEALGERGGELEDVNIACSQIVPPMALFSGEHPGAFHATTYFMGAQERSMYRKGLADFTCVHLSQVDIFCRETAPADVAFFEVSPPDENGYMSYGATGVALHCYIKETAGHIVAQVNPNAPYVFGEDNLIHISEVDAVVEAARPLPENPNMAGDETIDTISRFLLDQIGDGACIQLGLGGVANAVGFGLKEKNDLGAHTELIGDAIMELMKLGVLNNSRKTYFPGKTVASFSFGSRALYDFIHRNPDVYYQPFPVVNDPVNIAKNDNMISINTAMAADIFGQINADNIAGRQHSATGGQVDFVRGAQMSRGGKSFIAMTSTLKDKQGNLQSRIVTRLPLGSCVTTPRSDVQYVATEYGCVNLKPLSMKDRIRAMISLAHPSFRQQLTDDAREAGLL